MGQDVYVHISMEIEPATPSLQLPIGAGESVQLCLTPLTIPQADRIEEAEPLLQYFRVTN